MADDYVTYLGRTIPKAGFRVFVYAHNNEQKLVESWEEYKQHIESGEWFPTKGVIPVPVKKPHDKGKK